MNGFTTVHASTSSSSYIQTRLYTINRSGSGEAFYVILTPNQDNIQTYQIKIEKWKATKDVANFGVAVLCNMLYVIGGFNIKTAKHIKRVIRYNPEDGLWTEMKSLPTARAKFATAVYDNKILVLGGEGTDSRVTSSCYAYDPMTNLWDESPSLVSPRANHACVVYNNELYSAGGHYGNKNHKNIWIYEGRHWEELGRPYPHQLPAQLDRLAMVTLGRQVYFIGGVLCKQDRKEGKRMFLTERRMFSYSTSVSAMTRDENENSEDNSIAKEFLSPWGHDLPNMQYPRHSHGAVAIGRRIYVIGGTDLETGHQVSVVECYDPSNGVWEEDFGFRKGDVSNVTCAILKVPYKHDEHTLNERLRWVLW